MTLDADTPRSFAELHQAYLRSLQPGSLENWLKLDLTVPQLKVLQLLVREGPRAPGALARGLHVSPSTITGLGDRLVQRGLVRREEDAGDRRVNRLWASAAGQALVEGLTYTQPERL